MLSETPDQIEQDEEHIEAEAKAKAEPEAEAEPEFEAEALAAEDGERKSVFDTAVELTAHLSGWVDWRNPYEIRNKPICVALAWLAGTDFGDLADDLKHLLIYENQKDGPADDYASLIDNITHHIQKRRTELTAFIKDESEDVDQFRTNFKRYQNYKIVSSVVLFLLHTRPCCQLLAVQDLIPGVAAGVPAINLISYAACYTADLMNDPEHPWTPNCISVGNSWFHRLGIFLLNCCQAQDIPPPSNLVRLLSLASIPPSSYSKYGKAVRMLEFLERSPYPYYLHEAPPGKVIGYLLAFELIGELKPNRQEQYFRRIERASTFYAVSLIKGDHNPSIKAMQIASDLSWADAKDLTERSFFSQLVFEQQCLYVIASNSHHDCPACHRVREKLPSGLIDRRMPRTDL